MKKEEKIKEAWGDMFPKMGVNKEGWSLGIFNLETINKDFFDTSVYLNGYKVRPKSLQVIETNNGWIKIESENDLPKKGSNCHFILKNGFSGIFVDLDDSEYLTLRNRGTHYQPIEKPLKPIY